MEDGAEGQAVGPAAAEVGDVNVLEKEKKENIRCGNGRGLNGFSERMKSSDKTKEMKN